MIESKQRSKHLVVLLAIFYNHLTDVRRNRLNFAPDINNGAIYDTSQICFKFRNPSIGFW